MFLHRFKRCAGWVMMGWALAAGAGAAALPEALQPPTPSQAAAARQVNRWLSDPRVAYAARDQDEAFLRKAARRYLDQLDTGHLVFLASDVEKFEKDPRWVKAALQGQALAAPLKIYSTYRERALVQLGKARVWIHQPSRDYPPGSVWALNREALPWPKDEAEQDRLWQASVQDDRLELETAGKTAAQAVVILDARYEKNQQTLRCIGSDDVLPLFLDTIAQTVDPHSDYFPPQAAEAFAIAMSLSLEGIGASLVAEKDVPTVDTITPGSPAEKSGRLSKGDQILAVGQEQGPMKDVVGLPLNDVVALIRGKQGSSVRLDVRKALAPPTTPPERLVLVRAKIELSDQRARGFMAPAQKDSKERVGVVVLPLFYRDQRVEADPTAPSAAGDVARAIKQLRGEGMTALVLDLRGNGGGVLQEAIDLVGLFVPPSPVVLVRQPNGTVHAERSTSAQPLWEGPLVVLVDRDSASASEVVAGALQDLGRARIVGEGTFGKGSVQTLVDLDRMAGQDTPSLGQIKLTTAQFFRPGGRSTQKEGVTPDLVYPTSLSPIKGGESSYDNALAFATVPSAVATARRPFEAQWPRVTRAHRERMTTDPRLVFWAQQAQRTSTRDLKAPVALNRAERQAAADRAKRDQQARQKTFDEQGWVQAKDAADPVLGEAVNVLMDALKAVRP